MKKSLQNQLLNLEVQNTFSQEKKKSPAIGIDYGEKFSGISWTPDGIVVLPLEICPTETLKKRIKNISQEKNIKTLVFGLPVSSDGSENHICKAIRTFGTPFEAQNFKVFYVNERYSSQNSLSPENDRVDDLAAAQILEFWIAQKNS